MVEQTLQPTLAGAGVVRAQLEALGASRGYDLVMRVVFICWFILLAIANAGGVMNVVRAHPGPTDLPLFAEVLSRSTIFLFLMLAVWLAFIRLRPCSKAGGLQPRISALLGTFLPLTVVLFPRRDLPVSLDLLSAFLMLAGHVAAVYALACLGRSFSIMAEARRLVTDGPYAMVRHPLYLAEAVILLGLFLQFAYVWTAPVFVAQFAFQLQRMRNEERVLSAEFPEYQAYARRTWRLIPGVY